MPHLTPIFRKYQEPFTDMLKCSVNSNPKGSWNTQSGIMPSNYYQAHQHHYRGGSYASHKMKLKKYQKLWRNIYQGELSDRESGHMLQMSSLSRKRMVNCVQYKTIDLSINGPRKTATYPH